MRSYDRTHEADLEQQEARYTFALALIGVLLIAGLFLASAFR